MKAKRIAQAILDYKPVFGDFILIQWSLVPRTLTLRILNSKLEPCIFLDSDKLNPEAEDFGDADLTGIFGVNISKVVEHYSQQENRYLAPALGGTGFRAYCVTGKS